MYIDKRICALLHNLKSTDNYTLRMMHNYQLSVTDYMQESDYVTPPGSKHTRCRVNHRVMTVVDWGCNYSNAEVFSLISTEFGLLYFPGFLCSKYSISMRGHASWAILRLSAHIAECLHRNGCNDLTTREINATLTSIVDAYSREKYRGLLLVTPEGGDPYGDTLSDEDIKDRMSDLAYLGPLV